METRSDLTDVMCRLRSHFNQLQEQKKFLGSTMQRLKQAYQLMEGVLDRHTKHLLQSDVTPPETDLRQFTTKYQKLGEYRFVPEPSKVAHGNNLLFML